MEAQSDIIGATNVDPAPLRVFPAPEIVPIAFA